MRLTAPRTRSDGLHRPVGNLDLPSVEASQDETRETLVVGATVIAEDPDRLPLPDEQALGAVGSKMHPRRIAPQRDVAGQLGDLAPERERVPIPRFPARAVGGRLNGFRDGEILVEERLEDGRAGAGVGGVGSRVRRVRGAALGESLDSDS